MPVAVRRPQQDTGPSGFQQFLQSLNIAAGIGGRVADYFQTREQQAIQREQLDIQRDQYELQAGKEADTDASRVLAMAINAGSSGRNATLATLAAQGQSPDPQMALAAITLGDIADPTLREQAREAVGQLIGREPAEIDDLFILSPDNLASEAERDISGALDNIRSFRRITGQATLPEAGAQAAARVGETGMLSLVPGSQVQSFERTEALQNEVNEMLRVSVDPDTGEYRLDGQAVVNGGQTLDTMLQMLGESGLPKEFDPSTFGLRGPNRIVSGPVWEQLWENGLQALWTSDENARQIQRQSAALLAEEFGMPFDDALAAIQGRLTDMQVGNARFIDAFRQFHRGQIEFVGNLNPTTRSLMTLMSSLAEDLNIPSEEIINATRAFGELLRKQDPNFPIPENVGLLNELWNNMFGGDTGFRFNTEADPSVFTPESGGSLSQRGIRRAQERTAGDEPDDDSGPSLDQTAREQAMLRAYQAFGQALRSLPEDERAAVGEANIGLHAVEDPETGETLILNITRSMIDEILSATGN